MLLKLISLSNFLDYKVLIDYTNNVKHKKNE